MFYTVKAMMEAQKRTANEEIDHLSTSIDELKARLNQLEFELKKKNQMNADLREKLLQKSEMIGNYNSIDSNDIKTNLKNKHKGLSTANEISKVGF